MICPGMPQISQLALFFVGIAGGAGVLKKLNKKLKLATLMLHSLMS